MRIAHIGHFQVIVTATKRGELWTGRARITPPVRGTSPFSSDHSEVHDGLKPTAEEAEEAAYEEALQMLLDR